MSYPSQDYHDSSSTHEVCGGDIINHDVFCPRRPAARGASWRRQEDRCVLLRFGRGQLRLCCRASDETAQDSHGPQSDYELWLVQEDGDLRKPGNVVKSAHPIHLPTLPVRSTAGALRRCPFSIKKAGATTTVRSLLTCFAAR